MKKVVMGCSIALVLGVGLVALVFYLAFRPRYKDVSDVIPFSTIVGEKITTKRKVLILDNPGIPINEKYTYHLEDGSSYGLASDLPTVVELPIGTPINIDKVELHTGRVSGTTSAYIFGKVYYEETQTEYAFQYTWGDYHSLYEDKPYWSFELAFWQEKALENKFYIEVP